MGGSWARTKSSPVPLHIVPVLLRLSSVIPGWSTRDRIRQSSLETKVSCHQEKRCVYLPRKFSALRCFWWKRSDKNVVSHGLHNFCSRTMGSIDLNNARLTLFAMVITKVLRTELGCAISESCHSIIYQSITALKHPLSIINQLAQKDFQKCGEDATEIVHVTLKTR